MLDSPADLPFARSAISFMYTGKLDVTGARALLSVRRLGAYLQVEGCVEACDEALTALVAASSVSPPGSALGSVADVFLHRALLPEGDEDAAAVSAILHACREQIVKHVGFVSSAGATLAPGADVGEVLVWAFADAPSLLSDPQMVAQLLRLPLTGMEALLGCDSFATDDEASVLVVLATWRDANPNVSRKALERLCRLIRLSQMSDTYLHVVLPAIDWFPISRLEHRFLCAYVRASTEKRKYMTRLDDMEYDLQCAWYSVAPRAALARRAVTTYEWYITEPDLEGALRLWANSLSSLYCSFSSGARAVLSRGFEWRPSIDSDDEKPVANGTAALYLHCCCPAVLKIPDEGSLMECVSPGPVELVLYKWPVHSVRVEARIMDFERKYVQISAALGYTNAIKLATQPAFSQGHDENMMSIQQWAAYLHQGRVHGALRWR